MIDRDELLISVLSDIDDSLHNLYDFERIIQAASQNEDGDIVVISNDFRLVYDSETYTLLQANDNSQKKRK
ncbi:hypothetical protein [Methanobrevibacter filiformis]|uniref:Uncharacterized protein n=1 Tax=Methanobrevibacter filiformis TaxID=55758 RepID=A0A166FAX2_9EURY|nr:hypothetical protein [Methanobrevibacter filiformis]KZX17481.1 hypothetical protein MBFIL_01390 [Methanobrevibacter filiformis]